jgi:hypothetical protein
MEDYVFAELEYTASKTCCWNSTTSAMAAIVLDLAKQEEDEVAAGGQCRAPTAFRAMGTGGDGFTTWLRHAKAMGLENDWRAWTEDEPCSQRAVPEDKLAPRANVDNFCAVLGASR